MPPLLAMLTPKAPDLRTVSPISTAPIVKIPPPSLAELLLSVLLVIAAVPMLKMPPPSEFTVLPLIVHVGDCQRTIAVNAATLASGVTGNRSIRDGQRPPVEDTAAEDRRATADRYCW